LIQSEELLPDDPLSDEPPDYAGDDDHDEQEAENRFHDEMSFRRASCDASKEFGDTSEEWSGSLRGDPCRCAWGARFSDRFFFLACDAGIARVAQEQATGRAREAIERTKVNDLIF
jgi:hypothetical protein